MLKITNRELNYISSPLCWNGCVYDYLSICYYELKQYKKAISNAETALKYSDESRIKENLKIFIELYKNQLNLQTEN